MDVFEAVVLIEKLMDIIKAQRLRIDDLDIKTADEAVLWDIVDQVMEAMLTLSAFDVTGKTQSPSYAAFCEKIKRREGNPRLHIASLGPNLVIVEQLYAVLDIPSKLKNCERTLH